jgi:hypothetical protein
LLLALAYFALALWMLGPQRDPDAFWHLRVADWMVAHRTVPTFDVVSWWSAGTAWINPAWANDLALWWADRWGGLTGQSLLYLPVYLGIVLLLERIVVRLHPTLASFERLLVVSLSVLALGALLAPRAGNFDLLFLLFAVWGWLGWRQGRYRGLWLMPLATVAWANLHGGGVLIYPIAALAFAAGTFLDRHRDRPSAWRPFGLSLGLSLAALALNPYGLAIYGYPLGTITSSVQSQVIVEWLAPNLADPAFLLLRLGLAVGLIIGLARAPQRDASGALLGGGLLFLGLASTRYLFLALPLLGVWYLPAIGRGLYSYLVEGLGRPARSALSTRAQTLLLGSLTLALALIGLTHLLGALPPGQAAYAAEHEPSDRILAPLAACSGHLWSDYAWGGYLAWRLDRPVGPYGAVEALSDTRLAQTAALESLHLDPATILDPLNVQALVTAADRPLAVWLRQRPDWRVVAQDPLALAAVRRAGPCDPGSP